MPVKPSKTTQLLEYVWNHCPLISPLQPVQWRQAGGTLECLNLPDHGNLIRAFTMPDNYAPVPVKRIAQIISHRHSHSDASPASSAIEIAKRIHFELVQPAVALAEEAVEATRKALKQVSTLTAMNGELTQRIDNLLLENAHLVAENNRLINSLRNAKEGENDYD
jgi:hypothetical protein